MLLCVSLTLVSMYCFVPGAKKDFKLNGVRWIG